MTKSFIFAALIALSAMLASAPARAQFADQMTWGATAGGSVNALTLAVPNIQNLNAIIGVPIRFIPSGANTGAATLAIGATGAVAIKKPSTTGLVALTGGELNGPTEVFYDGTEYVLAVPYTPITTGGGGADGNVVAGNYSGTCPTSGTGVNGDYAYDVSDGFVYGPKSGGAWPCTPAYKPPTNILPTFPAIGSLGSTTYTISCGGTCIGNPPAWNSATCPNPPSGAPGGSVWTVVMGTGVSLFNASGSQQGWSWICLLQRVS